MMSDIRSQGLSGLDFTREDVRHLIAEIGCLSSYQSLIVGELPGVSIQCAENILSESGFMGAASSFDDADTSYGRWESV